MSARIQKRTDLVMSKLLAFFVLPLTLFLIAGCVQGPSVSRSVRMDVETGNKDVRERSGDYVLQCGDVIEIKFFYNPELNERVIVRPDGKISLQLIDEVVAAGLTPSELDRVLTRKFSDRLLTPDVTVIVKEFAGMKVYVGGEVNTPGMIPISGRLTTLQAILQAGGFKKTAELGSVVVLHHRGDRKPVFLTVNLKADLATLTLRNDILLSPYDIVFVPQSTIAKMDQFVAQYIEQLIPISKNIGFSWIRNLNPEVQIK